MSPTREGQWPGRTATAMAAAAFALAAAAQSPSDFAWRLPLSTTGDGAFFRVEVPASVYEGALRADLGDVRVFNGQGAPVPIAFLARPAAAREAAAPVALPLFPLRVDRDRRELGDLTMTVRRDAAGTTVNLATRDGAPVASERLAGYLVDASAMSAPPAALTLTLPEGANVSTRVRVEGSDDLAAWRVLNGFAPVLAVEFGGRRLSLDRVDLAPGPAKYLRITTVPGQPPLEIAGARGEVADRLIEPDRQSRRVVGVADKANPGDYVFDLGGALPVDRVALDLPEINTVAPAQVYARRDPKDEWRAVGATVFYRLKHQDTGETTSPPWPVAAAPARYWKVSVDARSGGLGNQPPALTALWIPQALVFAARGGGPFELAYGSAQAKPVALPIATLVPGFDTRVAPATFAVATVGAATIPPAMAALQQPIDLKRWLLWAALGLAALVLGWMAHSLGRQMRRPASAADDAGDGDSPKSTDETEVTDPRATLLDWLDLGALPRERFGAALRVAGVAPGPAAWRKFLETLFLWLGAASLAASVVFFIAANWQALGRFAKFGMVEIALVAAIALAVWRGLDTLPGKAALVCAALLAGALLALVGQVYQTGADTFELFAAWAVAIVAWVLVARLPVLWMVWIAILNLAAILYFQVVPGRGPWMLFGPRTGFLASFALNALALLAWEYVAARGVAGFAARWAPRVLAFAAGVGITVLAVLAIVEYRERAGWHLAIYGLWLGTLFWAYRVRSVDLFILSGGVLSAIVVVAVGLARTLFDRGGSAAVLLMAIVVVAGAGLGAYWLRRVAAEDDAR